MKFRNDLTTRQWSLYKYFTEQDGYKTQEQIIDETGLYNHCKKQSGAERALRRDVRALRASLRIQYTIISGDFGYKIATKKEYEKHSKSRWSAIAREIKLQKLQDKKAGLDNQTRLVFGKEKDVIEAFREVSV